MLRINKLFTSSFLFFVRFFFFFVSFHFWVQEKKRDTGRVYNGSKERTEYSNPKQKQLSSSNPSVSNKRAHVRFQSHHSRRAKELRVDFNQVHKIREQIVQGWAMSNSTFPSLIRTEKAITCSILFIALDREGFRSPGCKFPSS